MFNWPVNIGLCIEHFVSLISDGSNETKTTIISIEKMFEKIISSHYLLLLLKIDPNQPSALVNSNLLNIRNVYSSFITINREAHIWYQEVYHALEKNSICRFIRNERFVNQRTEKIFDDSQTNFLSTIITSTIRFSHR